MVILISDKIGFKITKVTRDKDVHFIMIMGILHQEDITLLNIYASNQGAPKYIKQLLTELKGETEQNTNIVGKLNTPLTALDTSFKENINREISVLDQMYIIDIYRGFHLRTSDYTFFSNAHGSFLKIDHMLARKLSSTN